MKIIAREGSKTNIGSFLVENREFFKGKITVEWANSSQEALIRQKLKINSLPILVVNNSIIPTNEIIPYLIDCMQVEEKKNNDDDYDSWMNNNVNDFKNKVKNNRYVDDDDDEVPDYNKKLAAFKQKREEVKPPKTSTKKISNEFDMNKFQSAIADNHSQPKTISDDDLEREEFLEMMGKL